MFLLSFFPVNTLKTCIKDEVVYNTSHLDWVGPSVEHYRWMKEWVSVSFRLTHFHFTLFASRQCFEFQLSQMILITFILCVFSCCCYYQSNNRIKMALVWWINGPLHFAEYGNKQNFSHSQPEAATTKGREKKRTINDIVHGLPSVHYISTENLLNSAHIFAVSCACNQWFESTERDRVQKWQRRLQLRNRNGEIFPHLYAVKSINIKYVCIFSLEVLVMLELHPPNLPLSWWFLSNQNWNAVSEHMK